MLHATLDTETTGLLEDEDAHVVEIGIAVHDETGKLIRTYESLVCPPVLTDEGLDIALRISGITEEMIRSAPSIDQIFNEISEVLDGFVIPVRCWNTAFDESMWYRTFIENHSHGPLHSDPIHWDGCIMLDFTEIMSAYTWRHSDGTPGWFKLAKAVSLLQRQGHDVDFAGDAHRALADTIVSGQIDSLMRRGIVTQPELPKTGTVSLTSKARPMPETGTISLAPKTSPMPKTGAVALSPKASPVPKTGTICLGGSS